MRAHWKVSIFSSYIPELVTPIVLISHHFERRENLD
jgi:hypothetical protein